MYDGKMKIRRFNMVNAGNGWTYHVVCVDREEDGEMVRTWSTDGRRLEIAILYDYEHLILPGTTMAFVLPRDHDQGE
jgi:hypothetical protein